jgi:hypothetical protein
VTVRFRKRAQIAQHRALENKAFIQQIIFQNDVIVTNIGSKLLFFLF